MGDALSDAGLPADIAREAECYVFILRIMADSEPRKTAILESYTKGFHAVFVATTAVSASALMVGFLVRKASMETVRLAVQRGHALRR